MLLFNGLVIDNYPTIPNFNTSNVTIQPDSDVINTVKNPYFNTSNVTIQHAAAKHKEFVYAISIHLMLLFNPVPAPHSPSASDFNTSNVTIQQSWRIWSAL